MPYAKRGQAAFDRLSRKLKGKTLLRANMTLGLALGVAGTAALIRARRRAQLEPLRGQVAVVIGGTRGLGLALARELVASGCRVAICGRDLSTLESAREELVQRGGEVLAATCDATDDADVERFIDFVLANYGRIDVLITVAATMRVGPIETMSTRDFHLAMNAILWSCVYPTLAVLPVMRSQQKGSLVHIASIGGRIAVPHLSPYSTAKFAVIGFSEGIRAELAKDGIAVTTVVPFLMRTASHLHARFKGELESEYTWFGWSANSPFAIDPDRAARRIVRAIARGERQVVIGAVAKIAIFANTLWPSATEIALEAFARLLPRAPAEIAVSSREGIDIENESESVATRAIERLAHERALRYHQR
jgi:short-subunit dehydrogenase